MSLKKAYLYLVSIISLVIMVIGSIILINLALRTWVFPQADRDFYSQVCYPIRTEQVEGECTPEEEEKFARQQREMRAAQKQRDAAQAISMLIVAAPVWYFHWRMARKEV